MKKFVRGQFGRTLSVVLMAMMMVPGLFTPFANLAQAATGGRQNILLLPLQTDVKDAPYNLAGRVLKELQISLGSQTGVEVQEFTKNSAVMERAKKQLSEEEAQAKLLESYDIVANPNTDPTERVEAAKYLIKALDVDAIVYGTVDKYEFAANPDQRKSYLHVTATKVTVENDTAMAAPLEVTGKSTVLPNGGGMQSSHDDEAISSLAKDLSLKLTGNPTSTPGETTYGADDKKPHGKKSSVLLVVGGLLLLAALAGGGGGSDKPYVPPTTSSVGWAYPQESAVDIQLVKPTKQVTNFQLYREDRGSAEIRTTRAVSRASSTLVQTVAGASAITQGNYVYLTDGANSNPRPAVGKLYKYSVKISYADGTREDVAIYNIGRVDKSVDTTGPGVPPPLQSVTATAQLGSMVEVRWMMGANLPTFVNGFVIERKLANDPPSAWVVDGDLAPASATSAVRSVPAAGQYVYRVFAQGTGGYVHPIQVASQPVTVATGKPSAVTNLTVQTLPRTEATAKGKVYLRVSWAPSADSFVTGYKVERSVTTRSRAFTPTVIGPKTGLGRLDEGRGRTRTTRGIRATSSDTFTVVSTITNRNTAYHIDNDVEDGKTYAYRVTAIAQTYASDPVTSESVKINLAPGEVTNLQAVSTSGTVQFSWQAPTTKADGTSTMTTGGGFEIYRSISVVSNTQKVTRADLLAKFTKIDTVSSWTGTSYTDLNATLRALTTYAVVPFDLTNQPSPGDYPVLQLTPAPVVDHVTVSPTDLHVTAGGPPEVLLVSALATDGIGVSGVSVNVSCTVGGLSLTTGTTTSQQVTVVTGEDGTARVYWTPPKTVNQQTEVYITANLANSSRTTETVPNQVKIIVTPPTVESVTLTLAQQQLVAVSASDPNPALTPDNTTTVTAKVTGPNGIAIEGRSVTFACNDTNVAFPDGNTGTTDANGQVALRVRSGYKAGVVTIVAFSGSIVGEVGLRVVAGKGSRITIQMPSNELPARANSTTPGTVIVMDANGNPVEGRLVVMSTNLGSIEPIVITTGSDGTATFNLKGSATPGEATITATVPVDALSASIKVNFVGLAATSMTLTSNVSTIIAAGDSQAIITATVYDSFGQPVPDNTVVNFVVENGGIFQGSSTPTYTARTTGGKAIAILVGTPSPLAKNLTVTATAGTVAQSLTILMRPKTDVTKVIIVAAKTTLVLDNNLANRQTTLDILVTDKGQPVANTPVQINTTAGNLSVTSAQTDVNGYIRGVVFTAPDKAQVVTITAEALGVTGAVQVTVRGGLPAMIELSIAGPWSLLRTNGRQPVNNPAHPGEADWRTNVYARVTDEYGNPVPDGTEVYFESVEPGSSQMVEVIDPYGKTITIPKPNTGTPYGTITPMVVTGAGACSAQLLSADRNVPAGGAEILVRVNRPDGRVVFSNTFRVAGPPTYYNRIIMAGAPVQANSSLMVQPSDVVSAGDPINIKAVFKDDKNQPCAGNTPYWLSVIFTDDNTLAIPRIQTTSEMVGGTEQSLVITDLKGKSQRPFVIKLEIPQQLAEPPLTMTSDPIILKASAPATMAVSLDPFVANTSATQIYTYPQPMGTPAALGPDQIIVVVDGIKDRYGNPVTSDETIDFVTGTGRCVPTSTSGMPASGTLTIPVSHSIVGGVEVAGGIAFYRSAEQTSEKIVVYCGGVRGETSIRVIGGSMGLTYSFARGGKLVDAVQVGCDPGSGYDQADATITATDVNGNKHPISDAIKVAFNLTQGTFLAQPIAIPLDANSQIKATFKVNANEGPGELMATWRSGKNGPFSDGTGLLIIGRPSRMTISANPSSIMTGDTALVTVRVTDAAGNPALQDAVTVQFTVNNPNMVMVPADGKVKVGADGFASVQVRVGDSTKIKDRYFTVNASAGGTTASTTIGLGKPAKTLSVKASPTLLPTDSDPDGDGTVNAGAEGMLNISAFDDAGLPVAEGTPVNITSSLGIHFVNTSAVDVGETYSGVFGPNGTLVLRLRGVRGFTNPGALTITVSSGAVNADNKEITLTGPPAKMTDLEFIPKDENVIGSPTTVRCKITDANDKPVWDGYKLDASVAMQLATVNGLPSSNTVSTSASSAVFTIVGQSAGTAIVSLSYGAGLSKTANYKFVGAGSMVFEYLPTPPRIQSNGRDYITITVKGYRIDDATKPVPDGTAITLRTDKGYFTTSTTPKEITGTFTGGLFVTRLYGVANPTVEELGLVTLTAISNTRSATGAATFYGPVTAVDILDPMPSVVTVGTTQNYTVNLRDAAGNPADGPVTISLKNTTTNTTNTVNVAAVNGTITTPYLMNNAGQYEITASSNGQSDTTTLDVVPSIPTQMTVKAFNATEPSRVAADGSGAPQRYDITATTATNQPAGNITATVTIERGALSPDGVTFEPIVQTLLVNLDNAGQGSFFVNGSTGNAPGLVNITTKLGSLTTTNRIRFVGPASSMTFTGSASRLLANGTDAITLTARVVDSLGQPVIDGTPVNMAVQLWTGGALPVTICRIAPNALTTTNGAAVANLTCSQLAQLRVSASVSGLGITINQELPMITVEGAEALTIQLQTGVPARISADGVSGPIGTNQTTLVLTGTAVDSRNNTLTGAQLANLPVTITTTKGTLNGRGAELTTKFDATGQVIMSLSGTPSTTLGDGEVSATSGAAATVEPQKVVFVGQADSTKFVITPSITDTNGNGIPDVYQDGTFTLDVVAKDSIGNPVLNGTNININAPGLTVTAPTDKLTANDNGMVRWTITASSGGIKEIFLKADQVNMSSPYRVEVIPIAKDFDITVLEENRIFFDPDTTYNLTKRTSFELTGYQDRVGGPVQPYAEVTLTTDMGQFIENESVRLVTGKNGKEAIATLNQVGKVVVRFQGDGSSVGVPNIRVRSGSTSKSLNTDPTNPIRLIGLPYRIITQAFSKYNPTKKDDLRVMQDDPVTIVSDVQDKAGQSVLDGFMAKYEVNSTKAILRAANSLIVNGTVKADLSSNWSGVYTVTAQALYPDGVTVVTGVSDITTVTIRTYAKTFTLVSVVPTRIAQDGTETSKVTVTGLDANNVKVMAGVPAQFTILQDDPQLATLVDPYNTQNYGDIQNVSFDDNGNAEIFIRGQGIAGHTGLAGVKVASFNTNLPGGAQFIGEFSNLVTLYGPGAVQTNAKLDIVMDPVPVVPGTTSTLTVSLLDKNSNLKYYPDWYKIQVVADAGILEGEQVLDPATGKCTLLYTISQAEAQAKIDAGDPQIHISATVTGNEQAGIGRLTQSQGFAIAPKPWPGAVVPAAQYRVDSTMPVTLITAGLNLTTDGSLTLQILDENGQPIGPGRDITIAVSDGGLVRDSSAPQPGQPFTTVMTGTDGLITILVTAPSVIPASGSITLSLRDTATDAVLVKVPAGSLIIPIKDAKTVADLYMTVNNPKRIYYSARAEDEVIAGIPTQTVVVVRGVTSASGNEGSAGATVTVVTDKGLIRKQGTGDAFTKVVSSTLDTNGYLRLEFQGNGTENELGMPTFTITDDETGAEQTQRVLSDANMAIVGKPASIKVTKSLAEIMQEEETVLTVTVKDRIGQNVLDGWPIEFVQTYTPWADPNPANLTDWRQAKDAGIFRSTGTLVTQNGVCSSTFASHHSGIYQIGAKTPVVRTTAAPQPPVYTYIDDMSPVTVKTYARNYKISTLEPKFILADGSQVSHLYVTCTDYDGKRVLEGVTVNVRPTLGKLLAEDNINQWTTPTGAYMPMAVNENAELRMLVRGLNVIGTVGITINNNQRPVSYDWLGMTELYLCGPKMDLNKTIAYMTPDDGRIAGFGETGNANLVKTARFTVTLQDNFGNNYPDNFMVRLYDGTMQVGSALTINGTATITYNTYVLGEHEMSVEVDGNQLDTLGGTYIPAPDGTPSTNLHVTDFKLVVTKPKTDKSTSTATMSPTTTMLLPLNNNAQGITARILATDDKFAIDDFKIGYAVVQVKGTTAATVDPTIDYTKTNAGFQHGYTQTRLNTGNTVSWVKVYAYYDADNNNMRSPDASEDVGATGEFHLGLMQPTAVQASTTGNTAAVTWTDNFNDPNDVSHYRIEWSSDNGATFPASNAIQVPRGMITVNGNNYSYTVTSGLVVGTTYVFRVVALNGAVVSAASGNSAAVTTVPAKPTGLIVAATGTAGQIRLTWANLNGEAGFQIWRQRSGIPGFQLVTTVAADTLTYTDTGLTSGTMYTYYIVAVNNAGSSEQSNTAGMNAP